MDFTQEKPIRPNYIRKYTPSTSLLIDTDTYNCDILLHDKDAFTLEGSTESKSNSDIIKNAIKHIQKFQKTPNILIIGTGEKQIFPDQDILKELADNNIAYEIMNTHSACRTFNILQQENRDVMAALAL
jgi:uncharacterized protein